MVTEHVNPDGSPQRLTDDIPPDELAIVAHLLGVSVASILADYDLQADASARHYQWLGEQGRLVDNPEWLDYMTSQSGG